MTLALFIFIAAPVIVTDDSLTDAVLEEAFAGATLRRVPPPPDHSADARAAAEKAKQTCQEARKLVVALKTGAAIEKYEQGLNELEAALPGVTDYGVIRECLIDLGAAWLDDDNQERAMDAFTRALMLDEKKGIDRSRYRPNVVAFFAAAKKAFAKAKKGTMTFDSVPKGREVVIDGKKRGTTPLSVPKLVAGEHWVLVEAPGFQSFTARLSVRAGAVERVDVILRERDRSPEAIVLDATRAEVEAAPIRAAATGFGGDPVIAIAWRDERLVGRVLRGRELSPLIDVATLAEFVAAMNPAKPATASSQASSAPVEPPPFVVTPAPRERTHWALAILPFGVGQFVEKRHGAGAALLVTELALLATNIACYVLLQRDRVPGGRYLDVPRDTAFTWIVNVSFGLLIAEIIGGAIDGVVHR